MKVLVKTNEKEVQKTSDHDQYQLLLDEKKMLGERKKHMQEINKQVWKD